MKRILSCICLVVLLSGCAGNQGEMDRAMALRSALLAGELQFQAQVTADYGQELYEFSVDCQVDKTGKLSFSVAAPESISGITGEISASGGALKFDETALAFPFLADGQITPVAAPWVLMNTLRSGYLTSCGTEGGILRISLDDSYEDDALHVDVWLDQQDMPARAEILWQGRRILSIHVSNFHIV